MPARCPGRVADLADPTDPADTAGRASPPVAVAAGVDSNDDGRADTVVLADAVDLALLTDTDGDGYADRELRIGPDGVARELARRPAPIPPGPLGEWPEEWAHE